jgi:hypothetical protein
MTSHELARLMLEWPDLPVATHANNHTYMSGIDRTSHGPLKVGRLATYGGDHLVIGNISKRHINKPNWYVVEMLLGDAPEKWSMPHGLG